jgi:mRNA interferase MazF
MQMHRGEVVTVVMVGDYGRPRPAVIVQTDALPETHASVIVCPMTSAVVEGVEFRVTIEPSTDNALRVRSQIMADKPTTVRRERLGQQIGRLSKDDLARLDAALAFVTGLTG